MEFLLSKVFSKLNLWGSQQKWVKFYAYTNNLTRFYFKLFIYLVNIFVCKVIYHYLFNCSATAPKGFMYWDEDDVQTKTMINGETPNEAINTNSILLVYALDFSDKVVKLTTEPILRRELAPDQAPCECVLLPIPEKNRLSDLSDSMQFSASSSDNSDTQPRGQVALVCRDGAVRLLDLSTLKTITEAKLDGRKFISATYCTSE